MPQLEVVFIINIKLLGVCFFNFKYSVNCDSLVKLRRNAGDGVPHLFKGERRSPLRAWLEDDSGTPGAGELCYENLSLSVTISCHHFRKKNCHQKPDFMGWVK